MKYAVSYEGYMRPSGRKNEMVHFNVLNQSVKHRFIWISGIIYLLKKGE